MATGIALTRTHQQDQIRNSAATAVMTSEIARRYAAGVLSRDQVLIVGPAAELIGHQAAVAMTRKYMVEHRAVEAPELVGADLVVAEFDLVAAVRRIAATVDALDRVGTLDRPRYEVDRLFRETTGTYGVWAARAVQMASRDTIVESAEAAGSRWRRVSDGDPCSFCAMLAGRGPVYRSRKSASRVVGRGARKRGTRDIGQRFHDHCGCTIEEVTGTWTPDAQDQKFVDLYQRAVEKCQADGVPATPENITKAMRELGQGVVHDAATPPSGEGSQSKSGAQPNSNSASGPDTQTGGTGGGGGQPPKRGTMQPDEFGGYPRPDGYRGRDDDPQFDAFLAEKVIFGIESAQGKPVGGHGYGQTPVGKNNTEFPKHWTDADIAAAFYETLQYGKNLGDGWSVRMEHEVNGILCELRFSRDSAHPEESVGFYPLSGAGVVKVSWLKGKRREQVTR